MNYFNRLVEKMTAKIQGKLEREQETKQKVVQSEVKKSQVKPPQNYNYQMNYQPPKIQRIQYQNPKIQRPRINVEQKPNPLSFYQNKQQQIYSKKQEQVASLKKVSSQSQFKPKLDRPSNHNQNKIVQDSRSYQQGYKNTMKQNEVKKQAQPIKKKHHYTAKNSNEVKQQEQPKKKPRYIAKNSQSNNQIQNNYSSNYSNHLRQEQQDNRSNKNNYQNNYRNNHQQNQQSDQQAFSVVSFISSNSRRSEKGNNISQSFTQEQNLPQPNSVRARNREKRRNLQQNQNHEEQYRKPKHNNNQQRSQTVANKNFKKNKDQYKNQCERYLRNCQKLKENQEEIGIQIKRLKKYFLSSEIVQALETKPKQITLFKSIDCPVLFFEYIYKQEKRYMPLRETSKGLKQKVSDFNQIVKKIYDMHYYPVDICYEQALLQFVKLKAIDIHLNHLALKQKKTFAEGQKKNQKLFYYSITKQNNIELIFFDYMMKEVLVGEDWIKGKKNKVSTQIYQNYQKFSKEAKKNDDFEVVNFGQEQVESDEQVKTQKVSKNLPNDYQLKRAERRLKQLLEKDISEIQQEIQEKNNQHLELIQNQNVDYERIQKLGDEIDKANRDLQNFKIIKNEIQRKINSNHLLKGEEKLNFLKLSVKRMILAEKQLESDLPILGKKKQIYELLEKNNLIILEGETGSGKSTQLPQILCEYYKLFQKADVKPVLVTQPRKIATRSLAERVAQELEQFRGSFVDYVASSTKVANPNAKIIFKLDRIVLDELVESPTLQNYSCLVIDEAHQRTISIDVILGLTKELLQKRKDFKVIITSASMQISLFQKYFQTKTLKVSGRMFPVDIKHFPSAEQDMVRKIQKVIQNELLTERNMLKDMYKGHILVFCSDTSQIQALSQIFKKKLNHNVFLVIPLHGKLTPQDQKKAFSKTKQHKLIFASRIAETAITIDGIKVVIDPGWDRQMQYNQKTKFSSMKLVTISQSSAKQRAGRAGRTQGGYCLRLYTEQQFLNRRMNKLPQIKNIALQTLVLRLKTLGIQNLFEFSYIERPDQQGMKASIEVLKMIGCLDSKQKITTIGKFLVKIPIEPFLARSIIEGLLMEKTLQIQAYGRHLDKKYDQFTESVIEILCMVLNAGNLFRIAQNFNQLGESIKYQNFSHQKGDFFFLKKIYDQFKMVLFHDPRYSNQWLKKNFLIRKTLLQVKDLVRQIQAIVKQFQVHEKQMKSDLIKCKRKLQKYVTQQDRILSCLTTSFAANLCLYSGHPQIGYTYLNLQKTVSVYGTSCLSLLGICPKWIIAYDFYENKEGKLYCKVANQINFKFLSDTVEDYVFQKYKLNEVQKMNPFYKNVSYELQTFILIQLKQIYRLRQYSKDKQQQFLKKIDLNFSESENKMSGFFRCLEKENNRITSLQNELDAFIYKLRDSVTKKYIHNYIGNIFVEIGNGFQIKNIQFKNTQTVFELSNLDEQTFNAINRDWSPQGYLQLFGKNKIILYLEDQDKIHYFNDYIDFLMNKQGKKISIRNQISDKRKKIPQTKIYLHWFAGKCQKNNILLSYSKKNPSKKQQQQIQAQTQRYFDQILQALQKVRQKRRQILILRIQDVKVKNLFQKASLFGRPNITKQRNGINVFDTSFDQIDMSLFLNDLISNHLISAHFQMPRMIKKFRQPQLPYCTFKDSEWMQKIKQLIEQANSKKQNCIRVWGYGNKKPGQKLSQFQKTFRIDLKAQIKTFDINLLRNMKNRYDGKTQVLGCEKLHVTSVFSQSIAAVDLRVFQNLKDEFIYNVDNFRIQYPSFMCDSFTKYLGQDNKKSKVYINLSSQNRQDLLKPMRILNDLFTPKYIVLQDTQFRYMDNTKGEIILSNIESYYEYKIYFGFDRYQKKLKLYCHDSLTKDIEKYLKDELNKIKYYDENISYKGKNLKNIQKMIAAEQKNIQDYNQNNKEQKFLIYEIKFTRRQISITADIETFNKVKNEILQIKIEENKRVCQICNDMLITPYRLYNCSHSFCWSCLSSIVRQFKKGQSQQLKCCYFDEESNKYCDKLINVFDISKILSQQQLQQIIDVKISQFIQSHLDKYLRCFSPNCEQIFQKQSLRGDSQINCDLCGKSYCFECKQSHQDYTCAQWKNRFSNLSQKQLQALGIKICQKCGNGIQRNQGCLHMTCKCGAHMCWTCGKIFDRADKCYDHLAKDHAGIFPNNPNI